MSPLLTDLMATLSPRQVHWLAERVFRVDVHHEWLEGTAAACPCRIPTPRTAPEQEAICG